MNENLPVVQHADHTFSRSLTPGVGLNAGAVAIEQERAIAEAQGQLTLAKKFPRSMSAAMTEFLETCKSPEFAKTAFYSVPNRGSGPSIRFAEEAARCYGNFQYGHRELSRTEGKSEIEVFAWDMQNNNYSKRQITVMHVLDTKNGPRRLTDQADIDNRIANVASKQMRGRILALLPKHLVAAGQEACKLTLAGGNDKPVSERIIAMAAAFAKFGVTNEMLADHLGHPVDQTTVDELADLFGVFNAIKEGARASDYFGKKDEPSAAATAAAAITNQAKQAAAQASAPAAPPAAAAPKATRRNSAQNDSNSVKDSAHESTQNQEQAPAAAPAPAPAPATPPASNPPANGGYDDIF